MSSKKEKQEKRLEKRKKKVKAFLEIARMNDDDRKRRRIEQQQQQQQQQQHVPQLEGENSRVIDREKKKNEQQQQQQQHVLQLEGENAVDLNSEKKKIEQQQQQQQQQQHVTTTGEKKKIEQQQQQQQQQQKPQLEGEDYQALRARLRARKKLLQQLPHFDLKSRGHDASVDVLTLQRNPLFLSNLRDLLLYSMLGDRAPCGPGAMKWCKLEKWNKIRRISVLIFDGLSVKDFERNRDEDKNIRKIDDLFKFKLEFVSAEQQHESDTLTELTLTPVTNDRRNKLKHEFRSVKNILSKGQAVTLKRFPLWSSNSSSEGPLKLKLLLNTQQMVEEGYPLPLDGPYGQMFQGYSMTRETSAFKFLNTKIQFQSQV